MITYIGFLRGINVGGHKLINMQELARVLSSAGFRNVRTYIQSGNVIFDSTATNAAAVRRKLELTVEKAFGYKVPIILKTVPDLERLIKSDPFKRAKSVPDVVLFVALLADAHHAKPRLPLILEKENLTVIEIKEGVAFVVAGRKKNGSFGFPNAFVEKSLGVPATTRNWNSLNKIVAFANTD